MNGFRSLLNRPAARRKRRMTQPTLEGLEDRQLLYATLGGTWAYASRITYSFVPDGTNIGGVSSNLYSTLNAVTSTANWQAAIEKAAAIWSSYANVNLALVSDNGAPFSTNGNQQDDSRFGDIRISMIPQSNGALAFALLPPPINGGTAAGDIVFNSNISWNINRSYDIETVALHEFGHALGLDHSAISSAVMYAYYNTIKQTLTTDDIAGIQSVFGAYPNDPINNGTFATAQNITSQISGNGQIALANQSLAGASDNDFFVVTVPANTTGSMTVAMQGTNLSSVSPKIVICNGSQLPIASASLPNSMGGTATVTITGVTPGQVYYIRAMAASAFGSYGAFGLLVNFGSSPQAPIPPPNTVVTRQPDQSGGSLGDTLVATGHTHKLSIGNGWAFGDVLTTSDLGANRLDPLGLSIPISPGAVSTINAATQTLINSVNAIVTSVLPPSTATQEVISAIDLVLSQLGSASNSTTS